VTRNPNGARRRDPAMKTFITLVALAFALVTGTSMMELTVHADRAPTHVAGHDTASLLY
jgi:hypothetical protein